MSELKPISESLPDVIALREEALISAIESLESLISRIKGDGSGRPDKSDKIKPATPPPYELLKRIPDHLSAITDRIVGAEKEIYSIIYEL